VSSFLRGISFPSQPHKVVFRKLPCFPRSPPFKHHRALYSRIRPRLNSVFATSRISQVHPTLLFFVPQVPRGRFAFFSPAPPAHLLPVGPAPLFMAAPCPFLVEATVFPCGTITCAVQRALFYNVSPPIAQEPRCVFSSCEFSPPVASSSQTRSASLPHQV